jgi:hypothetical protein
MKRFAPNPAALKYHRQRLFSIVEISQGLGEVTDADDHCDTASELANYAEGIAMHMDEAAAKARKFAKDLRRGYGIEEGE